MQQRKIVKFIDGDNFNLLVSLAIELTVLLLINFHGNFRLAFDDVEVGDEITVVIDEKTGAEAAGRFYLHHGFANLFDERTHIARRGTFGGRRIKLSGRGGRSRDGGSGRARARDAGDGGARNHQHGVAEVNDVAVRFLREDFAGDGGGIFELERVGKGEWRAAREQRGQGDEFLERHWATIDHSLGFDKRAGVQS